MVRHIDSSLSSLQVREGCCSRAARVSEELQRIQQDMQKGEQDMACISWPVRPPAPLRSVSREVTDALPEAFT